jgi:hypothetical protein
VAAAGGGAQAWTTALEKHVAFFDTDNDGIVSFSETEQGEETTVDHASSSPLPSFIGLGSFFASTAGRRRRRRLLILAFVCMHAGLRAIGLGAIEAAASATLINGAIGPKTRPVRPCSFFHLSNTRTQSHAVSMFPWALNPCHISSGLLLVVRAQC